MVFQPIRCTAHNVAIATGKLLPHLFTLAFDYAQADLLRSSGGHSLLHYYTLTDIFLLGNMVLCVARTFLSFDFAQPRWNSLLRGKDKKLQGNLNTICNNG